MVIDLPEQVTILHSPSAQSHSPQSVATALLNSTTPVNSISQVNSTTQQWFFLQPAYVQPPISQEPTKWRDGIVFFILIMTGQRSSLVTSDGMSLIATPTRVSPMQRDITYECITIDWGNVLFFFLNIFLLSFIFFLFKINILEVASNNANEQQHKLFWVFFELIQIAQ